MSKKKSVMNQIEDLLMGREDGETGSPPNVDDFLISLQQRGIISPRLLDRALKVVDHVANTSLAFHQDDPIYAPCPQQVQPEPNDLTVSEVVLIAAAAIAVRNARAQRGRKANYRRALEDNNS